MKGISVCRWSFGDEVIVQGALFYLVRTEHEEGYAISFDVCYCGFFFYQLMSFIGLFLKEEDEDE